MSSVFAALSRKGFHARIVILALYLEKISPWKLPLKIVRKLVCQAIYHVEVHPDSFASPAAILSLRLPHPFLIIVHRSARIGSDVTLFHNVTIGAREKGHAGLPVLGDGVYVGTGATILGALELGASSVVGAGSLVLANVPAASTVVGVHK